MAEFGVEQTDVSEIGNAVTPKEARSYAPVAVEGLTNIFEQLSSAKASKQERAGQEFIAQFTNKQLSLVQAVEQGMDSKAARARLSVNLQSAIQTHPSLGEDIMKAQSFVLGKGGMGEVVFTGADPERTRREVRDKLVQEGFVSPDASEEQFTQAEQNFRLAAAADEEYKRITENIALEKSVVGLDKAKLELLTSKQKAAAKEALVKSSPASMDMFQADINKILTAVKQQGMSQADATNSINTIFAAMEAKAAPLFVNLDSTETEALKKPFTMMRDIALKQITGELEVEEAQRNVDRIKATTQSQLLADPKIAAAYAASDLFGNNFPMQMIPEVTNAIATRINQMVEGNGVNVFDPKESERRANQEYFKMLTSENLSDEERQEVGKHLAGIFEGVVDYQGIIARNPKGVVDLTNFMSTQKFLQLRKEHPEAFQNLDVAKQVLNANYYDEVFGMVENEFRRRKVQTSVYDPFSKEPVSSFGTVSSDVIGVRPSSEGMEFYSIDPKNEFTSAEAKRLNKELRPVVNRTIKAMAHLNGDSNYGKLWEQVSQRFMTGEGFGTDEGDDLELGDFQQQLDVTELPEEVQKDNDFLSEVSSLSTELGVKPSALMAVMDFETGGTFDPAQKNAGGSSATGLIQFMAETAEGMGTSTEELAGLTRAEQMNFVRQYFEPHKEKLKGGDVSDLYMAVLWPKAVGKPDDYVLWRKGSRQYEANSGLDRNKNGTITKAEAASKVKKRVSKYET